MNPPAEVDTLIIGAGLSGSYIANKLTTFNRSVIVLDARSRIGGRLLTANGQGGVDLGGAWIWPRSEYVMNRALQEYNVKTVPMWYDGAVFARSHNGQHHVIRDHAGNYAACGAGAVRVVGGAFGFVQKLLKDDPNLSIWLSKRVTRIEYDESGALVHYQSASKCNESSAKTDTIRCRSVVLAAPPKVLINTIQFVPPLPKEKSDSMHATPTWMEDYGKVAISFKENWWRREKMSAISIDQIGAVQTWWEACSGRDGDGTQPTLAGFVTANGANQLKKMLKNDVSTFYEHTIGSIMQIYGVDKKTMGIDESSTCGIVCTGAPGEDGLVVTKGEVSITYKRSV